MPPFTRNLTFVANDLGREATLLLVFDDTGIPGQYRTIFPVAWKVSTFGASGAYSLKVTYHSEFGFTRAESGGIVEASAFIHMNPGEKTILEKQGGVYQFTRPSLIQPPSPNMEVENGTSEHQDIGFGIFSQPERPPQDILLFDNLNAGSIAQIGQFNPIISAYVTSDYKQGQILRGQPTVPVILKENLAHLEQDTIWKLEYNPASGQFHIVRERWCIVVPRVNGLDGWEM